MTAHERSSQRFNASPPFPCLRRSRLTEDPPRHIIDISARQTYEEERHFTTPRSYNRSRTLSGGLPDRKVVIDEEDEYSTTGPETPSSWLDHESMTPPRTVARVYAASAPRQRRVPRRSPSPAPRKLEANTPTASRSNASWLIPHQHPLKILWDVLTVLLSLANAYATHMAIRDRQFGGSPFIRFCEIWFVLDILLNFCVQRTTSDGTVLRTYRAVWARYLTSWFVVDVLSLFPAELLFLQPIVEAQKRRTFWQKGFFRTKAVVKVTRWLRLQHVRYLARVSQHTKRAAGIGASRLLRLAIRYAPKYVLFIRKTRGVLCVRLLRQFRWTRQMYRDFCDKGKPDNATCNLTEDDAVWLKDQAAVADWEVLDDGDPF
mmetsp:Transcript_17994/g.34318  ORF Transcript_17994/g.34318 Transcript_17994/m.34318 type:complete len:375 (-) Transcript_17994:91-1215(-)